MIIKRKNGNVHATVHQFCNDWITGNLDDGSHILAGVRSVQLGTEEVARFRAAAEAGHTGQMFVWFDLSDDGQFTRKRGAR